MASGTFSITTPIYYVNDRPHIGHCFTTVVADALARYHRLLGNVVFFLTGTDEHGQKVEKSAQARGVSPQALADENAAVFREAMAFVGASNNDFIRTTQPRHTRQVQEAWKRLVASGDVYLGTFEGWYDEGQEEYVTENQAREKNYTAFNGKPLVKAREQNYYFRLSAYQQRLEAHLREHPGFVRPQARLNEVLGRLRDGLQDVPFSRTTFRWGIPVPDAPPPGHVMYVWIDALLNYATALGVVDEGVARAEGIDAAARRRFWPTDVHLIGKEILWFHAVIWPAMLMALRMDLPRTVYAHSFWISEGQKMSKTLGNFIDLDTLRAYAERYSIDAVRWYMLTQGPLDVTDADWVYAKFVETYNAELANGIGNSTSRVGNMIEKYFGTGQGGGTLPPGCDWPDANIDGAAARVLAAARGAPAGATARIADLDLAAALRAGVDLVREVDLFINETSPFKLAKTIDTDPGARARLARILYICAESLRIGSLLLAPAMPFKMAALWRTWNCSPLRDPSNANSGFAAPLAKLAEFAGPHALKPGQRIAKGEPLFMRADDKQPPPGPG